MDNSKSSRPRLTLGAGISSLIIIFVALSIAIFSVLILLTVRQDLESAEIDAAFRKDYYAADTKATETLAQLNIICSDISVTDYTEAAAELGVTASMQGGRGNTSVSFSWSEEVNDATELQCKALLSNGSLTITAWNTVNKEAYINSGSLPIWDGENLPQ